MRVSQAIRSSIRCLILILSGGALAYLNENYLDPLVGPAYCFAPHQPDPQDYPQPVPANCNDGGLNVTLSLSVNKVNPLDLPGIDWYNITPPDRKTIKYPIIATANIHNTNSYPVSVDWTRSPIDDSAGSIGVFRLYCQPNGRHIPIWYINAQRGGPPVSIPARETIKVTHVLRIITDTLRQLPDGRYLLRVEGYWRDFQQERPQGYSVLGGVAEKVHTARYCFLSPATLSLYTLYIHHEEGIENCTQKKR